MKNHILYLVTIASCAGLNCLAQDSFYLEDDDHRTFYGGVILGTNFTQVDGDNYRGYKKVGLNAGGIVYVKLAEKLAGSIEILYVQKGTRGHQVQESGIHGVYIKKYVSSLNYAEVPIQLNYYARRQSHFGGGFLFAHLTTSSEVLETNTGIIDTKDYPFRKIDINFILTGNLHLYKGLFLNARFQYSILPVRTKIVNGFGRPEQFNNVLALRLMYLF